LKNQILEKLRRFPELLLKYRLLIFFISTIAYLELVYKLWNFKELSLDYIFPVLFALSVGAALFLISGLFPVKANRIVTIFLTSFLIIVYGIQLIYYSIFRTPLSIYSITGADDTIQFIDIIFSAIINNIVALILLFVPLVFLLVFSRKFSFSRIKPMSIFSILLFYCISYTVAIICVNLTGQSVVSQYSLYYKDSSPEISVCKLGLLTTMRLDFERLVLETEQNDNVDEMTDTEKTDDNSTSVTIIADMNTVSPNDDTDKTIKAVSTPEPSKIVTDTSELFNIMSIDFKGLEANEKNQKLLEMHKYFSSVEPTNKNQYTGMFKGNNLILITAESFSPYAIDPTLTPTLYKMSKEGFAFNNFYNPLWGVSTSDGEYVACTGLIPKSGVWSFARSGKNYLPFVMGNQFKKLGVSPKAYHNHSFDYYKRDISHPNMGYDYKGVGNGLKVKKTWPESDLEMINVTAEEFIGTQPFHTYYMTVSGHLNYTFAGNAMASKNKALVADLPYSEGSRAYIACNMELEFAMKALIEKLEAAGIADNTVIAISPDHYPYGLPRECIDELAGHEVENNFELYKSSFILWKKGMKPVSIDKACSSLDINPTLSNLFGLEYDSRLLMGTDILSDTSSLVIFSNRSWITDIARYNSVTNTLTFVDENKKDVDYEKAIHKKVADKFEYSAKILETDYYSKVVPQ
jgi:lipoteichoic acid synthase